MNFKGEFFDGRHSKGVPAVVTFEAHLPYFTVRTEEKVFQIERTDADILEPIGKKHGMLVFSQNQQIQIPDRQTHRDLKKMLGKHSFWSWVDNVENSWPLVLASIAVVVFFIIFLVRWGLPAAAHSVAHKIPEEMAESLGKRGLSQLEAQFFSESEIETAIQDSIREQFQSLLKSNRLNAYHYDLHFFNSEAMGANALALPSGDIVLLDGLLDIGLTHDEILAVLAHEIAHVEEKHGMQMLLRYAGISTLIAIGFGDINSSASLLVMIPKLLVEKGYSRAFESEADMKGAEYLIIAGYSPDLLASGLQKLGDHHGSADFMPTMISSHPDIEQRAEKIREIDLLQD